MLRLYRLLLLLYPSAYRQEFADEMVLVFRQRQRDFQSRSFTARVPFSLREIAGLLVGAFREQMKGLNVNPTHRAARSFRFPHWMIISMVLALLFVLTLIETVVFLMMQSMSTRPDLPPWGFLLPDFVLAVVVTMCFLGLIGFALRVVLRRTGIQRLPEVRTRPSR